MEREFEHRLTIVEDRSESNSDRLDELERRQDNLDELVGTVKVLAVREENVENDVKEIKSDVKSLTNEPKNRWNRLVEAITVAVVGILVGFVFAQIGI